MEQDNNEQNLLPDLHLFQHREQNCRNARQPANEHRRVLPAGVLRVIIFFFLWCMFLLLSHLKLYWSL